LRIAKIHVDYTALKFIDQSLTSKIGEVRLLAHRSGMKDFKEKERSSRLAHGVGKEVGDFIFLEVELSDTSEFATDLLELKGSEENGYKIIRCSSPAIPNAIAAVLLDIRDRTKKIPHIYFGWAEGHPIAQTIKYVFLGEGEIATLTREI